MLLGIELKTLVVSWSGIKPLLRGSCILFGGRCAVVSVKIMSVACGGGAPLTASFKVGCFRVFVAGFQIDAEPCELQVVEFLLTATASNPLGQELRINANYILAIQ